jgi:hypothetical protein
MKRAAGFCILLAMGCDGKPSSPPETSGRGPGANINPSPVPSPSPRPEPSPAPDPDSYTRYCPSAADPAVWGDGACFPNIKRSEIPAADDYFLWFEATWKAWNKSLILEHTPKIFLKTKTPAPDHIEYIDETKGSVPGVEKLKAVIPEMLQRCPSMADERFKAPLIVYWRSNDFPGTAGNFQSIETQLNDTPEGDFYPAAPLIWSSWINVKGEYVKPANTPKGWDGYKWPEQTFLEQTGGKSWAAGGRSLSSLDQTFSHEYGHFIAYAWSLNTGRSPIQSYMFSEMLAELVRVVCWGDVIDDPVWTKDDAEREASRPKPYETDESNYRNVSRRWRSHNYKLYSLEKLIIWQTYKGIFDSDKFFRAIWDTMEAMTGRIIKDYPAYSSYDGELLTPLLPWSRAIDNKAIIEKAPMMFTRQEFLEKFCDHYPCGELEYLLEADAEGNRKTEW